MRSVPRRRCRSRRSRGSARQSATVHAVVVSAPRRPGLATCSWTRRVRAPGARAGRCWRRGHHHRAPVFVAAPPAVGSPRLGASSAPARGCARRCWSSPTARPAVRRRTALPRSLRPLTHRSASPARCPPGAARLRTPLGDLRHRRADRPHPASSNPVGMQLTVRNVGRVHKYRSTTCVASVRSTGGRGERLVRGQTLAEAA